MSPFLRSLEGSILRFHSADPHMWISEKMFISKGNIWELPVTAHKAVSETKTGVSVSRGAGP